MKFLIALLLLPCITSAQSKFDYGRYTSLWVQNDQPGYQPANENNLIKNNKDIPVSHSQKLSLYIPGNNQVTLPNGNSYLVCYLINYSPDSVSINRCDATIYPAETQILVNAEWKNFQVSMGSSCGNSYFSSTLFPRSYYALRIERRVEGDIPVKFRVKLKIGNSEYFSNPCVIKLPKAEIDKAGQAIKPFSM